MKRSVAAIVGVVVLGTSIASANVFVEWTAQGGFYFDATPSVGILGAGTGNATLAQLLWSPDQVRDGAMEGTTHNLMLGGNDVWLADLTLTEGVGGVDQWAWWSPPNVFDDSGAQAGGGYIYARVFQDDTIAANDWFFAGAIVSADNLNPGGSPPDTPQAYEINTDLINGNSIDGTAPVGTAAGSFQVAPIPEPGSMFLFALGLVTLAVRRRRR